jgi:hypothetical protein
MVERGQIREAITNCSANQTTIQSLRAKKAVVEAELMELKIVYAVLENIMRSQVLQLNSSEWELRLAYNEMASLKQGLVEMRES